MKYTAQGESRVANITQGEASAIFVMRLSPKAVCFIQMKWYCFKLYFIYLPKYYL